MEKRPHIQVFHRSLRRVVFAELRIIEYQTFFPKTSPQKKMGHVQEGKEDMPELHNFF